MYSKAPAIGRPFTSCCWASASGMTPCAPAKGDHSKASAATMVRSILSSSQLLWLWSFAVINLSWHGALTFWLIVLGTAPRWSREALKEALRWNSRVPTEITACDVEYRETPRRRMVEVADTSLVP